MIFSSVSERKVMDSNKLVAISFLLENALRSMFCTWSCCWIHLRCRTAELANAGLTFFCDAESVTLRAVLEIV